MKISNQNKTIPIGNNPNANHVVYGDDCYYENTLVFAFVGIKRELIKKVEQELIEIKKHFKIPNELPLHCRVLFSPDQRRKKNISHLTTDDARSVIYRAVSIMNRNSIYLRFAFTYMDIAKEYFDIPFEMKNVENTISDIVPAVADPKGILSILMPMCLTPYPGLPTLSNQEIIVAEDATRIKFIGKEKRRVDSRYRAYSDINAPLNSVNQLEPRIETTKTAPLLQLADIAVYLCAHALDKKPYNRFFRDQFDRIKYWTRAPFNFNSNKV